MWGKRPIEVSFGRLGADAERLARYERHAQFTKFGLLASWILGSAIYVVIHNHETIFKNETKIHFVDQAPKQPKFLKMDETPFADLRPRHEAKGAKRKNSEWFVWGVSRFNTPSFYLGFEHYNTRKKPRSEIRENLKRYGTLTNWGRVISRGPVKGIQTDIGRFRTLEFVYKPPAGSQNCIYFSSHRIAPGIRIRGHYCVASSAKLDFDLLRCALSSVRHHELPKPRLKPTNRCNGRKIEVLKLNNSE